MVRPHPLPRLAFLQDALEFPALLVVEDLFDLGLAFTQHGSVILPEIVEDGLHLLLLDCREVEFALHAREIEFPAGGGIEGRLVQEVMHAEIHGHRSRRRAAQEHQRQRDHAGNLGIPRSGEARFLEEIRAHRWSSWPACFPAPRRYRRRANPAAPSPLRETGPWGIRFRGKPDSCPAPPASKATQTLIAARRRNPGQRTRQRRAQPDGGPPAASPAHKTPAPAPDPLLLGTRRTTGRPAACRPLPGGTTHSCSGAPRYPAEPPASACRTGTPQGSPSLPHA